MLNNEEKFSFNVPFGSKLLVEENQKVSVNDLLAEWDPYTLPIIAEKEGFIKYVYLQQGISFRESIDDTTGISSKIVIDWSQNPKSKNFKPAINIVNSLDEKEDIDEEQSKKKMSSKTKLQKAAMSIQIISHQKMLFRK